MWLTKARLINLNLNGLRCMVVNDMQCHDNRSGIKNLLLGEVKLIWNMPEEVGSSLSKNWIRYQTRYKASALRFDRSNANLITGIFRLESEHIIPLNQKFQAFFPWNMVFNVKNGLYTSLGGLIKYLGMAKSGIYTVYTRVHDADWSCCCRPFSTSRLCQQEYPILEEPWISTHALPVPADIYADIHSSPHCERLEPPSSFRRPLPCTGGFQGCHLTVIPLFAPLTSADPLLDKGEHLYV